MRTRLICDSRYEEARVFLLSLTRGEGPVLRTFCDNRNKVWLTMHGDERWVVKRYKRPTLLNRFVYATLRPSKAERAFRYAYRLLDAGFDTAEPVAYIETFSHGMFDIGYFVSRHVDLPDLTQLDGLDGAGRQRLFDDLGRHTARMHDAGIVDFDYNVHNILWRRDGGDGFRFTLVDINRTRFGDRRLLHCAIALATNAELPRFIDSYCAARRLDRRQFDKMVAIGIRRTEARNHVHAKIKEAKERRRQRNTAGKGEKTKVE